MLLLLPRLLSHSPDFLCVVVAVTALAAAVVNVVPLLSAVKDYIDKVLQAAAL